jgi:lipid-A-disaccharide synthase
MAQAKPKLRFVLPVAKALDFEAIKRLCDESQLDIVLTREDIYDSITCCDAIISCSGTVTLEIALLGVPMCIIYKMSWLTYAIMSRLITIPYVGLVNIVAGKSVVKEFLQNDATADNISQEMLKIIDRQDYQQQIIKDLTTVRKNLGEGDGSLNMARLVLSFLEQKS